MSFSLHSVMKHVIVRFVSMVPLTNCTLTSVPVCVRACVCYAAYELITNEGCLLRDVTVQYAIPALIL